jgi:hypothetical protein
MYCTIRCFKPACVLYQTILFWQRPSKGISQTGAAARRGSTAEVKNRSYSKGVSAPASAQYALRRMGAVPLPDGCNGMSGYPDCHLTEYIWAEAWQFPCSLGWRAQHVTPGPEHSFIADGEAEERGLTWRRAGPAVESLAKEKRCTPAQPACNRACSASAALLIKEFGSGEHYDGLPIQRGAARTAETGTPPGMARVSKHTAGFV